MAPASRSKIMNQGAFSVLRLRALAERYANMASMALSVMSVALVKARLLL